MPADTGGEPGTKEEVVDSEFGGGQDTEPLRPSTTGIPLYHLGKLLRFKVD